MNIIWFWKDNLNAMICYNVWQWALFPKKKWTEEVGLHDYVLYARAAWKERQRQESQTCFANLVTLSLDLTAFQTTLATWIVKLFTKEKKSDFFCFLGKCWQCPPQYLHIWCGPGCGRTPARLTMNRVCTVRFHKTPSNDYIWYSSFVMKIMADIKNKHVHL